MKKTANHRKRKPSRWHVFVARIHASPASESQDVNSNAYGRPPSSSSNGTGSGAATGTGLSSKASSSKISIGVEDDANPTRSNGKNDYELPGSRDSSSHPEYDIECLSTALDNIDRRTLTKVTDSSNIPTQNQNPFSPETVDVVPFVFEPEEILNVVDYSSFQV